MTAEKMKRIEMRRIRTEYIERRARRREEIAWWFKIAVYIGLSALAIVCGYAIVKSSIDDLNEEDVVMSARHDLRVSIEEANKVSKDSAGYGAAQLAKVLATALLNAEVVR